LSQPRDERAERGRLRIIWENVNVRLRGAAWRVSGAAPTLDRFGWSPAPQPARGLEPGSGGRHEGKSVLFVLPVKERGGGANVVFSEACAMAGMGVDARVVNLTEAEALFRRSYPSPAVPVAFVRRKEIPALARSFDAVVATANASVEWLRPLANSASPVLGYYVQDFEPYFYPPASAGYRKALESYTLVPRMVLFTKTEWNAREVEAKCGVRCAVVGPSVDLSIFRPAGARPAPPPARIAAMIRPSSPRRQPGLTLDVLGRIRERFGDRVEVVLFGETGNADGSLMAPAYAHRHLGILDGPSLAALFSGVHVFADFSEYQAMGLTAMEAMACGAAAIVPRKGGTSSFAEDGVNALVVDTADAGACAAALSRLVEDPALARRLGERASLDASRWTPDAAARRILERLFPEV
jgi:glycosyltransferase involved in cell wall biosynthesis